jgi:folate-binding protein YgfZ
MTIPDHYGDPKEEYRAARDHAAMFDLSDRGKIELAGKEALFFLNNLCTNDVKNLQVNMGCEAFLCTAKAKVVAHIFVSYMIQGSQDVLLLDFEPGQTEKVLNHLNHYLISEQLEIKDASDRIGMFHVSGPKAASILGTGDFPVWHHRSTKLWAIPCHLRRHDPLRLLGFDAFFSADQVSEIWKQLATNGFQPAGRETWEMLRIEAGTPVYGKDIDDNRLVMEVGRTQQAISYTKGCFLGQEPIVMARDRGHVNRTLLGIKIQGGGPPAAGTRLFQAGAEVGQVTSSVVSYRLGPIALAYLKRAHQEAGTIVDLDPATDGRTASVCALPFGSP